MGLLAWAMFINVRSSAMTGRIPIVSISMS